MLSIFSSLLTYDLLAPLILRLAAAIGLGYHGYQVNHAPESSLRLRLAGWSQIIAALLLLIGFWTQPVALLLAVLIVVWPDKSVPRTQRWLMVAILLSLLFTGPGFLAIDLPR